MYAAQIPVPNLAMVPSTPQSVPTFAMQLPLNGEGGRRADVLRGLWRVVFGRLRGGRMCLKDNIQVIIAAHEHVFPLGDSRQTDVGDRRRIGYLLSVLLPLFGQVEVPLMDINSAGAARDRLLGNAHEGQVGVCWDGTSDGG
jgi:hypothetical protein